MSILGDFRCNLPSSLDSSTANTLFAFEDASSGIESLTNDCNNNNNSNNNNNNDNNCGNDSRGNNNKNIYDTAEVNYEESFWGNKSYNPIDNVRSNENKIEDMQQQHEQQEIFLTNEVARMISGIHVLLMRPTDPTRFMVTADTMIGTAPGRMIMADVIFMSHQGYALTLDEVACFGPLIVFESNLKASQSVLEANRYPNDTNHINNNSKKAIQIHIKKSDHVPAALRDYVLPVFLRMSTIRLPEMCVFDLRGIQCGLRIAHKNIEDTININNSINNNNSNSNDNNNINSNGNSNVKTSNMSHHSVLPLSNINAANKMFNNNNVVNNSTNMLNNSRPALIDRLDRDMVNNAYAATFSDPFLGERIANMSTQQTTVVQPLKKTPKTHLSKTISNKGKIKKSSQLETDKENIDTKETVDKKDKDNKEHKYKCGRCGEPKRGHNCNICKHCNGLLEPKPHICAIHPKMSQIGIQNSNEGIGSIREEQHLQNQSESATRMDYLL